MTRSLSIVGIRGLTAIFAALILVGPARVSTAQTRQRGGGEPTGGQAVPRGSAPAPAPPPTGRRTSPAPSGTPSGAATNGTRPRGNNPIVSTAVPRGTVPPPSAALSPSVVYYGGFWPWGFGGVGFGSYYGSLYDPYLFALSDPYAPYVAGSYGYGLPGYGASNDGISGYGYPALGAPDPFRPDGALRLKVKPRDAQVFVDGYYAGVVDDFDGAFQRLRLSDGPHRIEVRAPGYGTLMFNVAIQFDETTTYEGELIRLP
jgi:hypothetical protein